MFTSHLNTMPDTEALRKTQCGTSEEPKLELEAESDMKKVGVIVGPTSLKSKVAQIITTTILVKNLKQKSQKTRNQWKLAQEKELRLVCDHY